MCHTWSGFYIIQTDCGHLSNRSGIGRAWRDEWNWGFINVVKI